MASYLEDTLLIKHVRKNPTLYNPDLTDYKDGALKDHIWEGVAAAVNKTSADCKRRWKYLRDSYNRCKRKSKNNTGFASLKTTKWCFFKSLQFLDKGSTDIQENDNADECPHENNQPVDENGSFEFCINDEDTSEKNDDTDADLEASRLGRKRKRETEDALDYNQTLVYVQDKNKRHLDKKMNESPGDEVDSFCSYIHDTLRKLEPALRVDAKSKIFNLMAQYEIRNLNLN